MKTSLTPINIFDFDGTLTTETWPKFWVWAKKFGYIGENRNNDLENALANYRTTHSGSILETFFCFFNDLLVENNEKLTNDELMQGEKYIVYNPGVEEFVKDTNVKNYIVSSGLQEFLQNLKLGKSFSDIYGTSLVHNSDGLIVGIGNIMTDEQKILAIKDILKKNNRKNNDCSNVFYIGDGYTDELAMKFVHNNGGKAIFVHQPNKNDELNEYIQKVYKALNVDNIVDYTCVANYTNGSELSNLLRRIQSNSIL